MRTAAPNPRFTNRTLPAILALLALTGLARFATTQDPPSQPPKTTSNKGLDPKWVSALRWRGIGPSVMVGRIVDLAVNEDDPSTFYVGTASGGVWKTVNSGVTFEPLLQNQGSLWIGDVELAKSNPEIVWVGTGENHPRNSVSYGDGIYKSTDGGKTFTHMGLRETRHISKIAIHPVNPDIVYVAALGRMWGPNQERGLFKTTDGGKSWTKIYYVDENTGVVDMRMDPKNPDTLYIASYVTRRSLYDNIPNYDPEVKFSPNSGIFKTTDGGATFKRLTNGLPTVRFGRVGLDVHAADPNILVATVETELIAMGKEQLDKVMKDGITAEDAAYGRGTGKRRAHPSSYGGQAANIQAKQGEHGFQTGGVFLSKDGGDSWVRVNSQNQRPMYFSQIRIDPADPSHIFQLGLSATHSKDGGKTFSNIGRGTHGDHHALWIDSKNGRHLILGNDGGVYQSWDRGRRWLYHSNITASQFYHVTVDNRRPYNIYGGLQDNGSWGTPSRLPGGRGATNYDWFNVGGGDGFVVLVDRSDPDVIYLEIQDGRMSRRNLRTGERASIRPARNPNSKDRFNWDTPMHLSHHNPYIFYTASQYVYRSLNRGDNLVRISPDITRTKRGSATRLGESPLDSNVLYVGTDDGFLWITKDGGQNWTNVADKFGAPYGFISSIECSRFAAGRAYVAVDTRRSNDLNAHVYVTEDFGKTWKSLFSNLPKDNASHVLREDVKNENVLYLGTHLGMYVSVNRGAEWTGMHGNMPKVTVHDIAVHPTAGEIVAGTHGRGIWIADVSALRQVNDQVQEATAHLFTPHPAPIWGPSRPSGGDRYGHQRFTGDRAPTGAQVYYSLGKNAQQVSLRVLAADGKVLANLSAKKEAGLHRTTWNLRTSGSRTRSSRGARSPQGQGQRGGTQRGDTQRGGTQRGGTQRGGTQRGGTQRGRGTQPRSRRRGRRGGPMVPPGIYKLVLTVDGKEFTRQLTVEAVASK